jgi:hypothetical protein
MTKVILMAACIVLTATRSITAQAPSPVDSSGVVVLNANDAPAEITAAQLVRGAFGAPETVRVTVRNRTPEPLAIQVDALLFTEKGILRMQAFSGAGRATGRGQNFGFVPALGTSTGTIVVHHIDAKPDWRVVVAIKEANSPIHKWSAENEVLKQNAHASLP